MKHVHKIASVTILALSPTFALADNAVFNKICRECHTGGFKGWVSGAPDIQDKNQWKQFLIRDSAARMKEIVLEGSSKHKKKGGCDHCSADDIANAVDHMIRMVK